jgi:hypothetical protein
MAPEEKSAKDGLAEDVKDTVEGSFGVRRDDIPAFTHAPGDGVQEPEADSPSTTHSVDPVDIGTEITSMATGIEDDGPGDKEEGKTAKDKVTPFIGAFDQGANQTSDNHDLIDQDSIQNSWPRKPGGQQKVEEQQWCCEEPYWWLTLDHTVRKEKMKLTIDMADIKDLSNIASYLPVASPKLDGDARPAKVGCHGEVSDSGNQCHAGGDVVEDARMSKISSVGELQREAADVKEQKSYLGLVNARPMKTPVEVTITAQAAQYQSLPCTVMWLSTVTVLVKPFTAKAPLPILLTSLEKACRVGVIAI